MTAIQLDIVAKSFLFTGVTRNKTESCCNNLTVECVTAGSEIYSAKHFRPAAVLLLSGEAEVQSHDRLPLNRLKAGDCFGVAAVFGNPGEYVTTVTAATDVTLVYMSGGWLKELFAAMPETAVNYITFLSGRICFLNRKIDSFTADNALDAVTLWLSRHAVDGAVRVTGGYTRLAQELNLGRASLYRALDALEAEKRISRKGKEITILME